MSCRTRCSCSARTSRSASAARAARSASSARRRKFAATLDILADMLVNSTFPPEALERLRAQRLVALNQAKAQPGSIASRVFPRVLYGDAHPFGQSSDRRDDQGHHARGRRRLSSALLQAGPRAHHRRRRRHARGDSPGHRKGSRQLGGGRRAPGVLISAPSSGEARRRSISSTSPARHSRRLRSACPAHRGPRPTTTRCRS